MREHLVALVHLQRDVLRQTCFELSRPQLSRLLDSDSGIGCLSLLCCPSVLAFGGRQSHSFLFLSILERVPERVQAVAGVTGPVETECDRTGASAEADRAAFRLDVALATSPSLPRQLSPLSRRKHSPLPLCALMQPAL